MFAATRWTQSKDREIRQTGIDVLASMIRDALHATPWNTANWAVANLYHATGAVAVKVEAAPIDFPVPFTCITSQ